MKDTANAIIIGAGIVGCSLAAELSRHMKDIIVLDRKDVNNGASSSNHGMVWIQNKGMGYDSKMAKLTQGVYEEYVANEFDIDIEYRQSGGLTIGFTDAQIAVMKYQCKQKQEYDKTPMTMLDREDTLRLEPNLNPEILGSIFCHEDATLNPLATAYAFARAAVRRGVEFRTHTTVTNLIIEGGKIRGVITDKGSIYTPIVVNCAGVWAKQIAGMAGIYLPVFPQRLQALVSEPRPQTFRRLIQMARDVEGNAENLADIERATGFLVKFEGEPIEENLPHEPVEDTIFTFIHQSGAGTCIMGTTGEFSGYDNRTNTRGMSGILKGAVKAAPILKTCTIIRSWAGLDPFTFDSLPFVGKVDEVEGFILMNGHNHAMAHAPALSRQIVALILTGGECDMLKEANLRRMKKQNRQGIS